MRKKHLITNLLFRSVDRTRFGAATGRRRRFPFSKSTRRKISEAFNHAFFNKKNLAYRKLTRLYGAGNAAYRFADLCSPTDSRCGSFKDATRLPPKNFGRIKSCSSAHYGLLDLPQAIGCPKDSLQAFLRRSQKGRICFIPAPSRSYRGLFVFPRKSCSSACPTYFRNRGFRRAAKYPMPAIFRRKASQNILTATLMPPIYGVQRGVSSSRDHNRR